MIKNLSSLLVGFCIALLIAAPALPIAQQNTVVKHRGGSGPPVYVTNTFVTRTSSTPIGSITSPPLTIVAGQMIYVLCDAAGGGPIASSSPSNTWVNDPGGATGTIGTMAGWRTFSAVGGSTTFTCTPPSPPAAFQGMIVLVYNPGSLSSYDTSTLQFGNAGPSTTPTTGGFTTTATGPSLIIECQVNFPATITQGLIAGTTGTLRQTDNGDASGGSGTGIISCEDSIVSSGTVSGTAATTTSVNNVWLAFVNTYK